MELYETPKVEDLGTLPDLTLAVGLTGLEDGMSKLVPFHHDAPSAPVGP